MKLEELTALGIPNIPFREWMKVNRKKAVQVGEIESVGVRGVLMKQVFYVSAVTTDLKSKQVLMCHDFVDRSDGGSDSFFRYPLEDIKGYRVVERF